MCRRACLTLVLCLVAAPVCVAGIATNRYTISFVPKGVGGDYLAARDGDLSLGGSTFGRVADTRDAADRWFVMGSKIKSSLGGGYLVYDPSGKSNRVFLTPEMGEGSDWVIGRSRAEGERGTIQAAAGPLQGWFLCLEEADGQPGAGAGKAGPRVVLGRDPARKLEAERIYEHK